MQRQIFAGLTLMVFVGSSIAEISEGSPSLFSQFERLITPDVGVPLAVSPGQRFYTDTWLKRMPTYVIPAPFESRMPGSMRIPFSFAIDSTVLVYSGKSRNGAWEYYVPQDSKFRAWHGLVGDVLSAGDTVGLRISSKGVMEWFVDNSVHNNTPTIWSRPLKKGDPQPTRVIGKATEPSGAPLRHLDYLGVRDNSVVIRYTELTPDLPPRVDEYMFRLDAGGAATGVVMGGEFSVVVSPSQRAEITMRTPIEGNRPDPASWSAKR